MKKNFLFLVLGFTVQLAFAQTVVVTNVDERVELMSVIYRLVGAQEYSYDVYNPVYTKKIDECFARYKDLDAIKYSTHLRKIYGFGYSSVVRVALGLHIKNGKVSLRNDLDIREIDARWNKDSLSKYVKLIDKFYRQSKFGAFFQSNVKYYQQVADIFRNSITDSMDFKWFGNFFGRKDKENFNLIIALQNGPNNYGPRFKNKKNEEEFYSVIGITKTDSLGLPNYTSIVGNVYLIAHEFSHSYWNPLLNKYRQQIEPQSSRCYNLVKDKMKEEHYGQESFFHEMVANISAIMYFLDHSEEFSKNYLLCSYKNAMGYIGIDYLFDAVDRYRQQRQTYPTIKDYLPELIREFNSLDVDKLHKEIEDNSPEILGTNIKNGDQNVDYTLDSIIVYFDRVMSTGNYGWSIDPNCKTCIRPKTLSNHKVYWREDKKSWIMTGIILEPDTEYNILYPNTFFRSPNLCYPLKKHYRLTFKTRKKQ